MRKKTDKAFRSAAHPEKLLTTILHAIGLERGKRSVAILNTIKCRPPMNADPSAEEMAACWSFLERQLELMDPKVIVAMGKPAAKSLFGTDETLTSRRQKVFDMVIAGKSRKGHRYLSPRRFAPQSFG